jgi:hypothetical protein
MERNVHRRQFVPAFHKGAMQVVNGKFEAMGEI